VLDVRRWAEIRRMREVEGLSIGEIARRTGHDLNTVRRALRRAGPPCYERPSRPSKLDCFAAEIHRLLDDDPAIPGKRILEILEGLGYEGSKTILYDYLREVRPHFFEARTFQRTHYGTRRTGKRRIHRVAEWHTNRPRPMALSLRAYGRGHPLRRANAFGRPASPRPPCQRAPPRHEPDRRGGVAASGHPQGAVGLPRANRPRDGGLPLLGGVPRRDGARGEAGLQDPPRLLIPKGGRSCPTAPK
jgi:hypothetical protein